MANIALSRITLATVMLTSALAGCGTQGGFGGSPAFPSVAPPMASSSAISGIGVVQSIETVAREQAPIGVGTIAGAVVGGIVGNQIGQGRGNTAATVAGVAGGALAGRELERRSNQGNQVYRIVVQMRDGSLQSVVQERDPNVRIGERVRIANGVVERA